MEWVPIFNFRLFVKLGRGFDFPKGVFSRNKRICSSHVSQKASFSIDIVKIDLGMFFTYVFNCCHISLSRERHDKIRYSNQSGTVFMQVLTSARPQTVNKTKNSKGTFTREFAEVFVGLRSANPPEAPISCFFFFFMYVFVLLV